MRSLACLRIGVGALVLVDLVIRSQSLFEFFSEEGLYPESLRYTKSWFYFSLHSLNGSMAYQWTLWCLAFGAGLLLLLGYKTRLSSVVSWVFFVSSYHRNSMILTGGEQLLSALLFWGMFLPWGKYFSVDQKISAEKNPPQYAFSMATVGYILQICIMYAVTVQLKNGTQWRQDHTAIYFVLMSGQYTTALGQQLLAFPTLLKIMTIGVIYLESALPILFLIPGYGRSIGIISHIALHLGIALAMSIGIFPLVSLVSVVGLIPSRFWEFLKFGKTDAYEKDSNRIWALSKNLFLAVILSFLIWSNERLALGKYTSPKISEPLTALALSQYWTLFTPQGGQNNWWHSAEGETVKGLHFDLIRTELPPWRSFDRPLNFSPPAVGSLIYPNSHWLKFLGSQSSGASNTEIKKRLGHYFCNKWNQAHVDEPLVKINVAMFYQSILPDEQFGPVRKFIITDMPCP